MLSIDIYLNETTRHADVILPAPGPLEKPHYDLALYQLAARNVANYSPAILRPTARPRSGVTLARLTGIVTGQGPDVDVDAVDGMVIATLVNRDAGRPALAHRRPRRRRDPRGARRPGAGRSGSSTSCCAAAPTATRSARTPRGSRSRAWRRARTAWTSGRSSRASPRSCARRRARSSWRRRELVADVPRLREASAASERPHGARGPPPAALEQLLDAQPRAAGEGQGPLHGARAPRRRRAAGADRRRPRACCARRPARSRRPWR